MGAVQSEAKKAMWERVSKAACERLTKADISAGAAQARITSALGGVQREMQKGEHAWEEESEGEEAGRA
eukprot:242757-Pleurochrysis_carterae.AAC.1